MRRRLLCAVLALTMVWVTVVEADEADASIDYCKLALYLNYVRGPSGGADHWRPCLELFSWDTEEALKIMDCESRGISSAVNNWHPSDTAHGGSWGLFQLAYRWWLQGVAEPLDPMVNMRIAHDIYVEQGWRPWSCMYRLRY